MSPLVHANGSGSGRRSSRSLGRIGLAVAAAVVAAITLGVYQLATGGLALPGWGPGIFGATETDGKGQNAGSPGPVIYYRDPDGKPAYSAGPRTTADGRAFVAVHASQDVSFEEPPNTAETPGHAPEGRILYYRNPMGLPDTSPTPKKDWMGMDYIPVYQGEAEDGSAVRISLDKVQRTGVRTAPVERRRITRPVRAPGVAKPDERTLFTVALRADSFIEKLYVNQTGQLVRRGDPMFRIYSPEMVRVQVDYKIAGGGKARTEGAVQRLRNLQIPERVIAELKKTGEPVLGIDWPAPVDGVVLRKTAVEGMMMRTGEEVMMLADLSTTWVIADVAEQDLGAVHIGSDAEVTFRAYPTETFRGKVTFILHELDMATRTAKVRIELPNPDHRIKHEMFAEVEITGSTDDHERVAVPVSALIDSGNRQVVIVDRGEGRFDPRPVRVGIRSGDFVEITEGVEIGENVVVAANFLIDAESNLKAALASFSAGTPGPSSGIAAAGDSQDGPVTTGDDRQ